MIGPEHSDVLLCDVRTGAVRKLRGHGDGVRALTFSPDGRRLFTGSADMSIRVWEVPSARSEGFAASGLELLTIRQDGEVLGLAFSADGHRLAVHYRLEPWGRIFDATPEK